MKKPSLMPLIVGSLLIALVFSRVAEADNLGVSITDQFVARTSGWWGDMQQAALALFKIVATLEICLFGIRIVLQKSQLHEIIGEFVMTLCFMGFIAAVILNYKEWATTVAITGLEPLTAKLSGRSFDVGSPVALIFKFVEEMAPLLKNANMADIGMTLLYVVFMAIIIATFSLICLKYILTVCEFHICAISGLCLSASAAPRFSRIMRSML